jgi:Xaa-Pro aminopeptidase
MAGHGLDAMLVSSPAAIRYLAGFTGSNGLLIVRPGGAVLLTDPRYRAQAGIEARGVPRVIVSGSLLDAARERGLLEGCRNAGFEDEEVSWRRHVAMRRAFPGVRLRSAGTLLGDLAAVKDDGEIEAIAEAARISDRVFTDLLPLIRAGVTELDLASEIVFRHRRYGADGDAFEPIVAAGGRSALPHARASRAKLVRGDLVVLDFGCTVRGYGSDLTRTVAVGRVSSRWRNIYRIVRNAQEEARAAVRSGASGRAVDAAARQLIRREGYGRQFIHALGHGLGLRPHEPPRLAPRSVDVLAAGNVVTLEPGIYLPDSGGVRIEDDVVVRDDGCDPLTASPKELPIL